MRRNFKRAFTFIEVLTTIVIIAVGLIGIMNWVPLAIETKIKTEQRTKAIFLAQKNIEEAKRILLYDFNSNISWSVEEGFNCTGDVTADSPDLKTLSISVWHLNSPQDITKFYTKVARR